MKYRTLSDLPLAPTKHQFRAEPHLAPLTGALARHLRKLETRPHTSSIPPRTAPVARLFRHITPGEEIRIEAAARFEDTRSCLELLTISASEISQHAKLPAPIRDVVNAGFEACARDLLGRMSQSVPPRLEGLLVLTLNTGMLVSEALELTGTNIDQRNGQVTLPRASGNGTHYRIDPDDMEVVRRLVRLDPSLPILRLTRASLRDAWKRVCKNAGLAGLTLKDLDFEAQYRVRTRDLR